MPRRVETRHLLSEVGQRETCESSNEILDPRDRAGSAKHSCDAMRRGIRGSPALTDPRSTRVHSAEPQ